MRFPGGIRRPWNSGMFTSHHASSSSSSSAVIIQSAGRRQTETGIIWSEIRRHQIRHVQIRQIQTGFSIDSPDYVDPKGPLYAYKREWRYMDCPSVESEILERNNVGMGLLVLSPGMQDNHDGTTGTNSTQSKGDLGLSLQGINKTFRKLRNLEVNSLKRVVCLTNNIDDEVEAKERRAAMSLPTNYGFIFDGISDKDLLILAAAERRGIFEAREIYDSFLRHYQELTFVLADYRKPLFHLQSGLVRNEGLGMFSFSNMPCVCSTSGFQITNFQNGGRVLLGGLSLVLAKSPIMFFHAITGLELQGQDAIYSGLANHFVSPESIPFMEITAEKISFETTERDGKRLIEEHFLCVPEPTNWFKKRASGIIDMFGQIKSDNRAVIFQNKDFSSREQNTLPMTTIGNLPSLINASSRTTSSSDDNGEGVILEKLADDIESRVMRKGIIKLEFSDGLDQEFHDETKKCFLNLKKVNNLSILALNLVLIQKAGDIRRRISCITIDDKELEATFNKTENQQRGQTAGLHSIDTRQERQKIVDNLTLKEVLPLEMRAHLILREGLMEIKESKNSNFDTYLRRAWNLLDNDPSTENYVQNGCRELEQRVDLNFMEAQSSRTEMSLSKHPLIRKWHPDYNETTKSDHNSRKLEAEAQRYGDFYYYDQITAIRRIIVKNY